MCHFQAAVFRTWPVLKQQGKNHTKTLAFNIVCSLPITVVLIFFCVVYFSIVFTWLCVIVACVNVYLFFKVGRNSTETPTAAENNVAESNVIRRKEDGLASRRTCQKCHAALAEIDKFCGSCGGRDGGGSVSDPFVRMLCILVSRLKYALFSFW